MVAKQLCCVYKYATCANPLNHDKTPLLYPFHTTSNERHLIKTIRLMFQLKKTDNWWERRMLFLQRALRRAIWETYLICGAF